MLGEYAGAIYFSQMHENGSKTEEDFTELKEKSIKQWLSSKWTSVVFVEFYFWVQKKTGGKPKQKTITPYAFFAEEVFKSPKYDWSFGRSNTGEKQYTLLKTNIAGGIIPLDFSYDFQEADLNGLADAICNRIRLDPTFSWKDAVLGKVGDTFVLVESLVTEVSALVEITKENTGTLQEITDNQNHEKATLEEIRKGVEQLQLHEKEKPVDIQPKIERFRVEDPVRPFIGRKAFLEKLVRAVKEGQGQGERGIEDPPQENITVVTATGGVGKTEIVRRYIQKHGHEYDHIVWIDAEDIGSAQSQFTQFAMTLSISSEFDEKPKPFDQILREIFETKLLPGARIVLLVLDNAEALDDDSDCNLKGIRHLLPKSLPRSCVEPTVIVTSRTQNWSVGSVVPLDLWSHDEVVLFVHRQLPLQTDEKALQQLGTRFGFLPVAIKSAIAVILQQKKWNKEYGILDLLKEYDETKSKRRKKVLEHKHLKASVGPGQTTLTLLVLWNISLEKIVRFEDGELAVKILCFMAYMSPTRIPLDFIFALFENSVAKDTFEIALQILEDYSLIAPFSSDNSDSRSFSIHRMIQDSTVENLKMRTNQGQNLDTIFNEDTFLNETEVLIKLKSELLNYVNALNLLDISTLPLDGVLMENMDHITHYMATQGTYLRTDEFTALEDLREKILWRSLIFKNFKSGKMTVKVEPLSRIGLEIMQIGEFKWLLASAYDDFGNAQKSTELFSKLWEDKKGAHSQHHSMALNPKLCIAIERTLQGKREEAMSMYMEFLQEFQDSRHAQSKPFLGAKTMYAKILRTRGETEEALEILTKVLEEQKKQPNLNCIGLMKTMSYIESALEDQGKLKEASEILEQNISLGTKVYGPSSDPTLSKKQRYATLLTKLGKNDKAILILLEVLEIQDTHLGSAYSETLDTKSSLAQLYIETREFDKALTYLDVEAFDKIVSFATHLK